MSEDHSRDVIISDSVREQNDKISLKQEIVGSKHKDFIRLEI